MTLTSRAKRSEAKRSKGEAFLSLRRRGLGSKVKVKSKTKGKAKDEWISVEPRRAVVPLFPKV